MHSIRNQSIARLGNSCSIPCRAAVSSDLVLLQPGGAPAQRVGDDGHRGEAHRPGGDHRVEQEAERRVERAGRDRHRQPIENEGEEQALPDARPDRSSRQTARRAPRLPAPLQRMRSCPA